MRYLKLGPAGTLNFCPISSSERGVWVGVRWWSFGDWGKAWQTRTGRRYMHIWVSLPPFVPPLSFTWFNRAGWECRVREARTRGERL
jgi:hypothetical protein